MQQDLAGPGFVGGRGLVAVGARLVLEPRPQHPGALLVEGHPEGAGARVDVEGDERLPVVRAGDVGRDGAGEPPEPPVLDVEDPQAVAGTQAEGLGSGRFPLGEALARHATSLPVSVRPAGPRWVTTGSGGCGVPGRSEGEKSRTTPVPPDAGV